MNILAVISNDILLPLILLVLIVFSLGFTFYKRIKYKRDLDSVYSELKVGDKVKTYSGIFGEIISIREAFDGSMVINLRTGEDGKHSYLTMDMGSVYNLDSKDEQPEEVLDEDAVEETKVIVEEKNPQTRKKQTKKIEEENKDNKENIKEKQSKTKKIVKNKSEGTK